MSGDSRLLRRPDTAAPSITPANGHENCAAITASQAGRDPTCEKIISGEVAASAVVTPTVAAVKPSVARALAQVPRPNQ